MTHQRLQRLPQMCFRQRDEPVQTLAPNRPDDAFTNRIRRGAVRWTLQHTQSQPFDEFVEISGEDAVAIMEQVFVSSLVSERFSQLLARPLRARMKSSRY